ncbi:MAG: TIGR02452 family protein [Bradymonadia bacterium]
MKHDTERPSRRARARMSQETVKILEAGCYHGPDGVVELEALLVSAVAGTTEYPPGVRPALDESPSRSTCFTVENTTTLDAAEPLARAAQARGAPPPLMLNFASAKSPGGGFLNGAIAQEESLAACSGLYACLKGQPMYAHHRAQRDPMYTDYAIYSPSVPVFRADRGALLAEPYLCACVTAPAVNAGAARKRVSDAVIETAMAERVEKVLRIAAHHGHSDIVLGAWGCGAFRNSPEMIARCFADVLHGPLQGWFEHVCFAVLDWGHEIISPFEQRFT